VSPFAFQDVAAVRGIRFEYFRGDTGKLWTVEPHGGGVACLDSDGDGREDLFFVNGKQLPPDPSDRTHIGRLYRQQADSFHDVTAAAGVARSLYGQGCASADYDNDAFPDLLATGWHDCVLWHNNGDGTFADVTAAAGIAGGEWNTGACFADFDRDGDLELFVANYLDFDPTMHKPCMSKELKLGYCGPRHYKGLEDLLYSNTGDGRFQDVSRDAGLLAGRGAGFGGVVGDVDSDGWPDLLVANDAEANFLWHNLGAQSPGTLRFRDMAMEWGIALNGDGIPEANMGIACGDFDADGKLDFGISHFYQEHFTLYRGLGARGFMDVTQTAGLDHTTRSKMGWGTGFLDIDADGWPDLFVVNGHTNNHPDGTTPYRMTPQVFRNQGGSRFQDESGRSGDYFQRPRIGRGTAVTDVDADGRPDIVVVHHHEPAALLANRTVTSNHRLVLKLVGRMSNRDAINARVLVKLAPGANGSRLHECIAGEGYLGSNDKRLWIGLGESAQAAEIEVHWPSGQVDVHRDLPGERLHLLVEGRPARVVSGRR
jgi:hypothetical protein